MSKNLNNLNKFKLYTFNSAQNLFIKKQCIVKNVLKSYKFFERKKI